MLFCFVIRTRLTVLPHFHFLKANFLFHLALFLALSNDSGIHILI